MAGRVDTGAGPLTRAGAGLGGGMLGLTETYMREALEARKVAVPETAYPGWFKEVAGQLGFQIHAGETQQLDGEWPLVRGFLNAPEDDWVAGLEMLLCLVELRARGLSGGVHYNRYAGFCALSVSTDTFVCGWTIRQRGMRNWWWVHYYDRGSDVDFSDDLHLEGEVAWQEVWTRVQVLLHVQALA